MDFMNGTFFMLIFFLIDVDLLWFILRLSWEEKGLCQSFLLFVGWCGSL